MKRYSKIKQALLKSGLPLEAVVARSLASLSSKLPQPLINHGEYFFKRPESELPSSVDFLFTHDLDIKDCDFLQLVFLIECKYRTRGTVWFFTQNPLKDAGMEFFIENFVSKGKCNRKTFPSLSPPLAEKLPIAGKGIEVYSNGGKNEKSIQEGIHQLMFAASNMLHRAFMSESFMMPTMAKRGIDIKGRSYHSLICPILATSSELRFLEDTTIKKIEQSEKVEDISKIEEVIVTSTPSPPLYIKSYINKTIVEDILSKLPLIIASGPPLPQRETVVAFQGKIRNFLLEYSMLFPSRYYVVNHQKIQDFVERYMTFAASLLAYAHQTKAEEFH